MNRALALIVDDEPDICELLGITLQRMQVASRSAYDLATARDLLKHHRFDLCLTDMRLPDGNGLDLVRHVLQTHPELPIAVITAHGNMETAIEALKAGAFDFLSKPVDLEALRKLATSALRLGQPSTRHGDRLTLIGDSPMMQQTRSTIAKLARSQAPIYISGESGTGKELVASLIHQQGSRAEGPFVPVNCGAIPSELMESELFGHRKGSFTGAIRDKAGLFQSADGGTLLLDEVGELPLQMQVKLLRAIQEKSVRPVGAEREVPVDVRILSATHKDLAALAQDGSFRQDLFYRINVIELHVPALREHAEDIPELAQHIVERLSHGNSAEPVTIDPGALEPLMHYSYPGNVRELENILERAAALCDEGVIRAADLLLPNDAPSAPDDSLSLPLYLEEIERQRIVAALEQTRWNRTAAAKLLGVSFRTLRYRLKKLGIE